MIQPRRVVAAGDSLLQQSHPLVNRAVRVGSADLIHWAGSFGHAHDSVCARRSSGRSPTTH